MRLSQRTLLLVLVVLFFETLPPTESSRCPISDGHRAEKEYHCPNGTKYHCFENKNGNMEVDGCFKVKLCSKGAHPQVRNGAIFCSKCKTGFQERERLQSNKFPFSYCKSYSSKCDTTSGYHECTAPSELNDRGCRCSAEHGYVPKPDSTECACFTEEHFCYCTFDQCPAGKVRGSGPHLGLCVLPSTTEEPRNTTLKEEITTKKDKDKTGMDSNTATSFPFEAILVLISLGMIGAFGVCWCIYRKWRRVDTPKSQSPSTKNSIGTQQNGDVSSPTPEARDQTQTVTMVNGTHPNGDSVIQMEGQATHTGSPGHQPVPQPSVVFNIVADKVHIGNKTTMVNTTTSPATGGMNEEDAADSRTSLSNGPEQNGSTTPMSTDGMEETSLKVPLLAAGGGDGEQPFSERSAPTSGLLLKRPIQVFPDEDL